MITEFFSNSVNSPFFGIILSIVGFKIGLMLQKKLKSPFINPLIIAMVFCIVILKIGNISYAQYNLGGNIIYLFLGPATAILAVSVYNQFAILKKNIIPVIAGTIVGSAVSIGSIILMAKLFNLDQIISISLYPKSVTTPIAIVLSEQNGGLQAITIFAVSLTGMTGAMLAPLLSKMFFITNEVAEGVAIGTSSHALGTTRALEMGETQGAMSSIAIAFSGIATVLLYAIFPFV